MASEGAGYIDFGRCQKCLATVPKIQWFARTLSYTDAHWNCDWRSEEHFHVTCWRCGFGWVIDAIDAMHQHKQKEAASG
jgi:hypothetical protein